MSVSTIPGSFCEAFCALIIVLLFASFRISCDVFNDAKCISSFASNVLFLTSSMFSELDNKFLLSIFSFGFVGSVVKIFDRDVLIVDITLDNEVLFGFTKLDIDDDAEVVVEMVEVLKLDDSSAKEVVASAKEELSMALYIFEPFAALKNSLASDCGVGLVGMCSHHVSGITDAQAPESTITGNGSCSHCCPVMLHTN